MPDDEIIYDSNMGKDVVAGISINNHKERAKQENQDSSLYQLQRMAYNVSDHVYFWDENKLYTVAIRALRALISDAARVMVIMGEKQREKELVEMGRTANKPTDPTIPSVMDEDEKE